MTKTRRIQIEPEAGFNIFLKDFSLAEEYLGKIKCGRYHLLGSTAPDRTAHCEGARAIIGVLEGEATITLNEPGDSWKSTRNLPENSMIRIEAGLEYSLSADKYSRVIVFIGEKRK